MAEVEIERESYENFLVEYLGVEKHHLVLCRYSDEVDELGYEGLGAWYNTASDAIATMGLIGWIQRAKSSEEAMI